MRQPRISLLLSINPGCRIDLSVDAALREELSQKQSWAASMLPHLTGGFFIAVSKLSHVDQEALALEIAVPGAMTVRHDESVVLVAVNGRELAKSTRADFDALKAKGLI